MSLNHKVKEFGKIYVTEDYKLFKKIPTNRKLNASNYVKIVRSMNEEQLVTPILVNENFEIIDGQHRYESCKELKLPVYFIIQEGYSTPQMKRANLVSANWKKDDFLNAHVNDGQESYITFSKLKRKSGLNTHDMLKIIAKVQNKTLTSIGHAFEEGSLEINASDEKKINELLVSLEDFNFFEEYKRTKFVSSFLELFFFDDYDHSQMKVKLAIRKEALEPQFTKQGYLKLLANKIYSFGTSKNNIYYDADRKKLYMI
jgi:hypothetical protein